MKKKSHLTQIKECILQKEGMKTTIVSRLFNLTGILMAIVIFSMIILAYLTANALLNYNNENQVENYAELASETVNQWIQLAKSQLEGAAKNEAIFNESKSMDERKLILASLADKTVFTDFSVAYPDGTTYNNTDISDRDYFKRAMNGETAISDPLLRKTDNSIVIMAATKVTVNGEVRVVYGAINVAFLTDLLDKLDLGESGYGMMINTAGTVVSHPNQQFVIDKINPIELAKEKSEYKELGDFIKEAAALQVGSDKKGTFTSYDGQKYVASFVPIENSNGWIVGILISKSEAQNNFRQITNLWLICGVALTLITLTILVSAFTKIAYPIRSSSRNLKRIANGELNGEFEEVKASGDEAGLLVTSFEETKNQLQDYISDISGTLESIANGDLTVSVDREYKGDFIAIKDSLNQIIDALNAAFGEASEASENLLNGAQQVEKASQSLANAAASQAGAVVEITASIEDIAAHTDANTKDVLRANELTQNAKSEASSGNEQMQRMVTAMKEISEASENIAKITKVIDSIAFQTNILALNASVEAARAGEHGKGFAVVAEEVRSLAGKSSEASAEIEEMINNSIAKINAGSKIAAETAKDLDKILGEIDEIANIMDNIATVSKDQAEAVAQVNKGIAQISNDVQNNSAVSEECAASSIELSNQAKLLMEQIEFYNLK